MAVKTLVVVLAILLQLLPSSNAAYTSLFCKLDSIEVDQGPHHMSKM